MKKKYERKSNGQFEKRFRTFSNLITIGLVGYVLWLHFGQWFVENYVEIGDNYITIGLK